MAVTREEALDLYYRTERERDAIRWERDQLADALTEVLADVDALLGNEPDTRMDSAIAASLRVQARNARKALAALEEAPDA